MADEVKKIAAMADKDQKVAAFQVLLPKLLALKDLGGLTAFLKLSMSCFVPLNLMSCSLCALTPSDTSPLIRDKFAARAILSYFFFCTFWRSVERAVRSLA